MNTELYSLRKRLDWAEADPRWNGLEHFLDRVKTAGIGLVSQSDRDQLFAKHLLPSLDGLFWIPDRSKVLDIGSGGGFPGIPLALCRPLSELLLVDSSERKTEFLTRVSRETSLSNVQVVCARVETLSPEHDGQYDRITARAVTELPELIGWTRRFLKPKGKWVLWKGTSWRKEGDLDKIGVILKEDRPLFGGGRLLVLERKDEGAND